MFGNEKIKDITLYYAVTDKITIKDYDKIVSNYIQYYNFRARRCKAGFYCLTVIKLLIISFIPIFDAMEIFDKIHWGITAFSSGIFFVESILEMCRVREKWILYRDTFNKLISVQRYFMGSTIKEIDENRLNYIGLVEDIIGEEAKNWYEIIKKTIQGEKADNNEVK